MIRKCCLAVALTTFCGLAPGQTAMAEMPSFVGQISAGTIAAISDGDFAGQSYATGRLSPPEAGHRDMLTVISIRNGRGTVGKLPVSNSVTAPPEVMELTRDGLTAFVVERLGERPKNGTTVDDLPPGGRLFAVDLADKAQPRIVAYVELENTTEGLAVSPDGSRVAVVSNTPDASIIQVVDYAEGNFGNIVRFDLAELGITGFEDAPRGGVTATAVNWHPSGRVIAVNINTQNRVVFLRLTVEEGAVMLRRWGNVVEVGPDPFVGRFTPDGRFYLTSDWGRNFNATTLEGRLPEEPSSISVIRLSDLNMTGPDARHERIGGAVTDMSAEGIAVSPDGRLVATINMRGTAFPPDSPRFDREATVSLLSFDPGSGAIAKVADYPIDGVLPEGGTFDVTGDHFLATVFQGHPGAAEDLGSGLEVFHVVKGEVPAFERVGRIPVPHGVHHVDVAP